MAIRSEQDAVAVRDAVAVADAFLAYVGERPEGLWAAPGRVNLIGEHTDYNDGFVLPLAVDRRAVVAARRREDRMLRVWSLEMGFSELALEDICAKAAGRWLAYVAGPLWGLAESGVEPTGLDIVMTSDVPAGAGLSSSAAIECAVGLAAHDLVNGTLSPVDLALMAQHGEHEIAGVPCGVMDQMASMLCTEGHALFLDARSLQTEQVPLPLAAAGRSLLVIDTRAEHSLVDGAYAERRQTCEDAARMLGVPALRDATLAMVESAAAELGDARTRRARHVVTEDERVLATVELLKAGRLDEVGPLLIASHVSLHHDFEVTVPELDLAVETAMASGAVGARMTGAGFGGCALAIVPTEQVESCTEAIVATFAERGFAPPACFLAEPSDGARRLQ